MKQQHHHHFGDHFGVVVVPVIIYRWWRRWLFQSVDKGHTSLLLLLLPRPSCCRSCCCYRLLGRTTLARCRPVLGTVRRTRGRSPDGVRRKRRRRRRFLMWVGGFDLEKQCVCGTHFISLFHFISCVVLGNCGVSSEMANHLGPVVVIFVNRAGVELHYVGAFRGPPLRLQKVGVCFLRQQQSQHQDCNRQATWESPNMCTQF